jgi:hypothetical protein
MPSPAASTIARRRLLGPFLSGVVVMRQTFPALPVRGAFQLRLPGKVAIGDRQNPSMRKIRLA